MKNWKEARNILIYVYVALLLICLIVNWASGFDATSIVINLIMFTIVGVIFGYSYKKFGVITEVTNELRMASNTIKEAFREKKALLWNNSGDFEDKILSGGHLHVPFQNYCDEMHRLGIDPNVSYKCDIEDYINQGIIEDLLAKNILSIVPGTMTGLGILGTFVGLALGLQNFETGTTDAIIESIPTLMDGVKIAFHTSIFGMVFSLAFNFIYKSLLENALFELDNFLDEFRGKVCPDSRNENEKELVSSLRSISGILEEMPQRIALSVGEEVRDAIAEILQPQLIKFSDSLDNFAANIIDHQNNALSKLVDKFLQEMNRAAGDNFSRLSKILEDTCDMQETNHVYMQETLKKTEEMIGDVAKISDVSTRTMESFATYISLIEKLQGIINENFMNVNVQLDANNQASGKLMEYVEQLVGYEKLIADTTNRFQTDMSKQLEALEKVGDGITDYAQVNMDQLARRTEQYNTELTEAIEQQLANIQAVFETVTLGCQAALANIEASADSSNKQLIAMASENSTSITTAAKQQLAGLDATSREMLETYKRTIETISQNAASNNDALSSSAQNQIRQIMQFSTNVTNELNRASNALSKSATALSGNLDDSLSEVLKQFDDELASISRSLSATISGIDTSTKQVPEVIAAAYDAMFKVFADMEGEIEALRREAKPFTDGMNVAKILPNRRNRDRDRSR